MGSLGDYAESELINHVFSTKESPWVPGTLKLVLSMADPGEDGTGLSEPAGIAPYTLSESNWSTVGRTIYNADSIKFDPVTIAPPYAITHFAILDAADHLIAYGQLTTPREYEVDDEPEFEYGEIEIAFKPGGVTTAFANVLLSHVFGLQPYTRQALYQALSTTTILDDGTGLTEPEDAAYERRAARGTDWEEYGGEGQSGILQNYVDVAFPAAVQSWGTITYTAWCDHPDPGEGNLRVYAPLAEGMVVGAGKTARFPVGPPAKLKASLT